MGEEVFNFRLVKFKFSTVDFTPTLKTQFKNCDTRCRISQG